MKHRRLAQMYLNKKVGTDVSPETAKVLAPILASVNTCKKAPKKVKNGNSYSNAGLTSTPTHREVGTPSATKIYRSMTPGQGISDEISKNRLLRDFNRKRAGLG